MSQCKKLRKLESKKSSVKENKEDYQHQYVDAYADNKILGRVNDDCWAEIFMYLSPFERPKVAWICKKWKQVLAYSWIDVKKLELTQWNYDEIRPSYMIKYNPKKDESLLGQKPLFRFLKSLLGNCGSHLSELDVTVYGHCNILPVISKSCRNLKNLKLKLQLNTFFDINENTFADLSKLKVLKIIIQYYNPIRMSIILFTLLRNVARTLTELSLSYRVNIISGVHLSLTRIAHVIPELKALKTIELSGFEIDDNLFMYLKNSQILVDHHGCELIKKKKH